MRWFLIVGLLICRVPGTMLLAAPTARPDVVFNDFEKPGYGDWTTTGTAFGKGPAAGTLPNQMEVSGYKGKRLINSYNGGDDSTGTLTSPSFTIERNFIVFLIGGGNFPGKTCVNLLIDGEVARTATGQNPRPGAAEHLEDARWDVTPLAGKTARIQIVDEAKGSWGHILVDHIVFTDNDALSLETSNNREITAARFLAFPVRNGAATRKVLVTEHGTAVRTFDIEAADGPPDWWANLDVSRWKGKTLKIEVDSLPQDSHFLESIQAVDAPAGMENPYQEKLRPGFHFSPARGWNNDPNGLVYFQGEYHLFFQHNPYATRWGNMHWGHAVSNDLVHWRELGIALYPDEMGTMFSGSAVVDWKNTSGLGTADKPPLVLIYTVDGKWAQCLASSTDGRTFTKYSRNPVVPTLSSGNRDPKVFWHEATKRWVMVLYVGVPAAQKEGQPRAAERNTVHFLTSPNLIDWKVVSQIDGFYECPDFFQLPVDRDPKQTQWALTAANSDYMLGEFDGTTFKPHGPILKGNLGRGFYAAQTFSDIPAADGRRIMIGWFQTPSPGMPFNQSMTVPLELKLLSTPDGPRLSYQPVKELQALWERTSRLGPARLRAMDQPLEVAGSDLLDVRLECAPGADSEIELAVRGAILRFDSAKRELRVNDLKAPLRLGDGKLKLIVLADRNSLEVFADDGLTYVPMPFIAGEEDRAVQLACKRGTARIVSFDVHALKSSWEKTPNR